MRVSNFDTFFSIAFDDLARYAASESAARPEVQATARSHAAKKQRRQKNRRKPGPTLCPLFVAVFFLALTVQKTSLPEAADSLVRSRLST
jgi:hypothetical protein